MTTRAGRYMRMVALSCEMEAAVRRASQQLGVAEAQFIEHAIARPLDR